MRLVASPVRTQWLTSPPSVSITEAPVRGGVGNPPGLTVSVDPGHRAVWVSPDPGPTPGQPEAW